MFDDFLVTNSINKILQLAGKVALSYGNYEIGTEHLLYGITAENESVASKLLQSYGVDARSLENVFSRISSKRSAVLSGSIELSSQSKEAFMIASQFAGKIGHNFIGAEHLLVSLLLVEDSPALRILKRNFKIDVDDLRSSILQVLKSENMNNANDNYSYANSDNKANNGYANGNYDYSKNGDTSIPQDLLDMGQDLTQKARNNKIEPIIGREEEIARVIEILCRKTKNNPILIGEPGVGKSAVVDGLALAIAKGKVPQILRNKTIYQLELGGLMAGTKYRGALEEKLKNLIETITHNENIIVFIDEIHTLVQAGSEKGEINPADMLKPYLARGEFQTIGATTTDEYRQYIEKDKALERRFQPIMVNPPSVEDTIAILRGLKEGFENYHKVKISDSAIIAAASLSDRYIMDRNLPDKAIDLIDEASSRAKVHGMQNPDGVHTIDLEIQNLELAKREALAKENYTMAGEYRDKIRQAQDRKDEIMASAEFVPNNNIVITEDDICTIISEWTKIPVTKITESEKDRLLKMESVLHRRVIGQDEAVNAVAKAIRRARIGLKDTKRPIGSFMFLGQTGVGKTELCKALAEAMFDNENVVIRIDMSEYMEKHSISKLIGSPPGYVGFDEGGQLTEQVRRRPYSVVLFDEIEKAHPDVSNLLLQVLDDGRLTDSQGRTVSFKNCIIIFTSNVGVDELPKSNNNLGFITYEQANQMVNYEQIKDVLLNALKRSFKPEFINRIDVITVFHPLTFDELAQIAKIFISNLNKRLKEQGSNIKVTESALKYLVEKGYSPEFGARPLKRLIEQEIEDKIAEEMLSGNINRGNTIIVSAPNNVLNFRAE